VASHRTIPHLVALHTELGGRRVETLKEAKRCAEAMKQVEAVIMLCDPDYSVHRIAVQRRNQTNP
jgi:5S rRNA maturation endonuclease (ribonuclease M5)